MTERLAVVISQGQSDRPDARRIEQDLVTALLDEPGIGVTVVPHLYDLAADSPAMLGLSGIGGNLVVCAWVYPRATHWILDRHGIRGRVGATRIEGADEDEPVDRDTVPPGDVAPGGTARATDHRDQPSRTIHSLDLRACTSVKPYVEEIQRIAVESNVQTVDLVGTAPEPSPAPHPSPVTSREAAAPPSRRWYPVIDLSRCTNCLECIDFCLFGVYGIDRFETILVEQPDNCRKGCPACSRVCPENAIMFPQHKTPAIAGSGDEVHNLKVDLSQLFGAPDGVTVAARERDEQLRLAGQAAVDDAPAPPDHPTAPRPPARDELDAIIDAVDQIDL